MDALKGCAIVLVILYHAGGVLGYPNVLHGEMGVDVFLLLSGLLLVSGRVDVPWRDFVGRRLMRIYPAYWLALGLLVWAAPALLERSYDATEVSLHLVGLHATWRGAYYSAINDSFWFISTITGLYGVFVLIRSRREDALFILGIGGLLTLLAFVPAIGFSHLAPRLPSFFVGMVVGQALAGRPLKFRPGLIFAAGMAALVYTGWAAGTGYLYVVSATAITGAGLWLFPLMRHSGAGRIALGPLVWLGGVSYEVYLLHQPLMREYNQWFWQELPVIELNRARLFQGVAVSLVITLLLAAGLKGLVRAWQGWLRSAAVGTRILAWSALLVLPALVLAGVRWGPATRPLVSTGIERVQLWMAPRPPALPAFAGWSGPLSLTFEMPAETGVCMPLVVTGTTGAADILGIRRRDEQSVEFVFDHWGYYSLTSEPVPVGDGPMHDVAVSMGSLLPERESGFYRSNPALEPLKRRLYVAVGDRVIFDREVDFHPAAPHQVQIGLNLPGGSVVRRHFKGRFVEIQPFAVGMIRD